MFPAPSAGASAPAVPNTGPGPAAESREAALAAREAAADALWNQAQAQLHFQGQLQAWLDGEDRRQDARELSQDAREAALDARIQIARLSGYPFTAGGRNWSVGTLSLQRNELSS